MMRPILNNLKNINKTKKLFTPSTLLLSNSKASSLTHKIQYNVLQNAKRLQTVSFPQ